MARTYYELHVDYDKDGSFGCEYGSYDREEVVQEQKDICYSYNLAKKYTRIVKVNT